MVTTSNTVVDQEGSTSHTRNDILTAQKIDVGIIFQAMLGTISAAEYLRRSGVPLEIALRVLTISHRKIPTPPLLIGDPKLPHVTTNAQKLGDIANVDALTVLKS